ncbi:MAG TPA: isocitrate/isopropylmalate family dehydrogenase, partial [Dongiaceae bacterium]|nr:isocitrate/isopropylmalate family dehydrogenase [Dongiaceae bacterium]
LGLAASANLHPGKVSLFESIHGSAPAFAGQNRANPLATIMAVSMMLEYLGEPGSAARIEQAVVRLLRSHRLPNLGMDSGFGTDQVGDLVLAELEVAPSTR